jgi:multidrug resistance efflux pump
LLWLKLGIAGGYQSQIDGGSITVEQRHAQLDEAGYLLANLFQENLQYFKPGQPVEAAIDLYPGQIFPGKVLEIWRGSGAGQMLPSGTVPDFKPTPPNAPQGRFAVAIRLDDPD